MYKLYFDGSKTQARTKYAAIIYEKDTIIHKESRHGDIKNSSNETEYNGLIFGLELCVQLGIKRLEVYGDSEIVINQVNRQYKVRKKHLIPLWERVNDLIKEFESITFYWVPRKQNTVADRETR